ncbi:MAG: peptide chain release factor N(5)-glutamine methyltransferase [Planctomycetales bacterium]|nr:peptide chain release factor N(5)-glutamine methyltransferase [Planctomycetales bacterium]
MNATETWTVGKLLSWTAEFLKKHGASSPRLDAEVLLAHVRGCQRIDLYTAFSDEPNDDTKSAFRQMVRQRAEGKPVAYLVGHKEFYSMNFRVSLDVLIPRPETEHLVVEALDRAKLLRQSRVGQARLEIADVGTGSGCVAIAIAKHLDNCRLTAIDVSRPALEIAKENARTHDLSAEQIEFVESDLFHSVAGRFDIIVSNPPYVSASEYAHLDRSVREYEPVQALVAGDEGYEVLRELLLQASAHLADDGYLIFEFSPMLAKRLPEFVDDGWHAPLISKDLAGLARIVTLQKK